MSYDARLLDPGELDLDAFAKLQRDAFAEVLQASGVSDAFMQPAHYRWKYSCPAGRARIAVVMENGELVASLGMFPLLVAANGRTQVAWQLCEGSTLPKARGKGYFTVCLNLLARDLQAGQFFFAFPNRNSKRLFARFGLREMQLVPTFVRLLPFARREGSDAEVRAFDPARGAFIPPILSSARPTLVRDAAYLEWRYLTNRSAQYTIYVHGTADRNDGYVVVREAAVAGRRVVLLMELHAASSAVERSLVRTIVEWGLAKGARYGVMVSNYFHGWTGLRRGFIQVPALLLPKRQVLMGFAATPDADEVLGQEWQVQLGDWDGF